MVKSCDWCQSRWCSVPPLWDCTGAWLTKKALGREKLLFREQIFEASKFILGSIASLSWETRLDTELTVYMPRSRADGLCYSKLKWGAWLRLDLCVLVQTSAHHLYATAPSQWIWELIGKSCQMALMNSREIKKNRSINSNEIEVWSRDGRAKKYTNKICGCRNELTGQ